MLLWFLFEMQSVGHDVITICRRYVCNVVTRECLKIVKNKSLKI